MTIRQATHGDLLILRTLWDAFRAEHQAVYPLTEPTDGVAWTSQVIQHLNHDVFSWIAFDGNVPVGFLLMSLAERAVGYPHRIVHLNFVYTIPSHRGRGVNRLLQRAMVVAVLPWAPEAVESDVKIGDVQWIERGWVPVSVIHARPFNEYVRDVEQRPGDSAGIGDDRPDPPAPPDADDVLH